MVDDRLTDTTSPSSDDGGDSTKGSYNTVRPQAEARPAQSFRTRLTLFFALTAVMTAVVLSIVLAITWEGQFQRYTRHNMERLAQATAEARVEDVGDLLDRLGLLPVEADGVDEPRELVDGEAPDVVPPRHGGEELLAADLRGAGVLGAGRADRRQEDAERRLALRAHEVDHGRRARREVRGEQAVDGWDVGGFQCGTPERRRERDGF